MAQADFAYAPVGDAGVQAVTATILAGCDAMREQWCEDAEGAGIGVAWRGAPGDIAAGDVRPRGDIVLVDCPDAGAAEMAALARIDERVARSGAQLVVAASARSLESVFGCLDASCPHILVDPSRADRIVALGRVMARKPRARLRELSDDDRLTLLRLTEQVGEIAERLERMGQPGLSQGGGAFRFESPTDGFRAEQEADRRLVSRPRPALPDPRLVRRIIRQRQARNRFFDGELFADPAWDMLLDLTAARAEHERVSVTSLCIASGVPATTALRWISQMVEAGVFVRVQDDSDKRRAFIALSDDAADAMARYFAQLEDAATSL